MKKTYDFDYDLRSASVKFEVDTEKFTNDLAQATLDFFSWDYDETEEPVDEVMKKYALEALREATFGAYGVSRVIEAFNGKEGYATIDGSMGIKLVSIEGYEFDEEFLIVDIKEIPNGHN